MVAQKPFWTEKPCSMNWTLLNFAGLAKGELKKKSIFHLRFQQYYVANSILQICFLVRKSRWSYLATCTGRI